MIGTKWAPSTIENDLYNIMEEYQIGIELYEYDVVDKVSDYLSQKFNIQWQLGCTEWQDMTGGVCYISFIDNSILHMLGFDYRKN